MCGCICFVIFLGKEGGWGFVAYEACEEVL